MTRIDEFTPWLVSMSFFPRRIHATTRIDGILRHDSYRWIYAMTRIDEFFPRRIHATTRIDGILRHDSYRWIYAMTRIDEFFPRRIHATTRIDGILRHDSYRWIYAMTRIDEFFPRKIYATTRIDGVFTPWLVSMEFFIDTSRGVVFPRRIWLGPKAPACSSAKSAFNPKKNQKNPREK